MAAPAARRSAHDIGVQAKLDGEWTSLRDGLTKANNSTTALGMPLRAVANGIEACEDHHETRLPGASAPPEPRPATR